MLNEFRPDPETFGAGIDGGSYFESTVLIKENSIEYVAFSGSIFSDYGDDGDVFFLVGFHEPIDSFCIDDDICMW